MIEALLVVGLAALSATAPDAPPSDGATPPSSSQGGAPATTSIAAPAMSLDEEPAFRAALAFYDSLELEKAAFRFQAAGRSTALLPADRARALAWLGVTLVQLGEVDDAAAVFADAVALDDAVVIPTKAPPQAESLLDAARRRATEASIAAPPLAPLVDDPAPAPAPPAQPPWLLVGGGALIGAGVGAAVAAGTVGARALIVADLARAEPFHGASAALYREAEADALVTNVLWLGAGAAVLVGAGLVAAAVVVE